MGRRPKVFVRPGGGNQVHGAPFADADRAAVGLQVGVFLRRKVGKRMGRERNPGEGKMFCPRPPRLEDVNSADQHGAAGEQKVSHGRGEGSESPVALPTAATRPTKRNTQQSCGRGRGGGQVPVNWMATGISAGGRSTRPRQRLHQVMAFRAS
jgi:hypothetical protein